MLNIGQVELAKLNTILTKVVDKYAHLIDQNQYKSIYMYISAAGYTYTVTCGFTELLYQNDIDPLKYMDSIPYNFMYGSDIKEVTIPRNIHYIHNDAFSLGVHKLIFEHGGHDTLVFEQDALWGCGNNLKEIVCSKYHYNAILEHLPSVIQRRVKFTFIDN